jgi:hypothetical protein
MNVKKLAAMWEQKTSTEEEPHIASKTLKKAETNI